MSRVDVFFRVCLILVSTPYSTELDNGPFDQGWHLPPLLPRTRSPRADSRLSPQGHCSTVLSTHLLPSPCAAALSSLHSPVISLRSGLHSLSLSSFLLSF